MSGPLPRALPSMHSRIKRGASCARLERHGADENDGAASAMFHETIVSGVE